MLTVWGPAFASRVGASLYQSLYTEHNRRHTERILEVFVLDSVRAFEEQALRLVRGPGIDRSALSTARGYLVRTIRDQRGIFGEDSAALHLLHAAACLVEAKGAKKNEANAGELNRLTTDGLKAEKKRRNNAHIVVSPEAYCC